MAVTLNVDQLTASTQELYLRSVEDQVHDRIPLVYRLRRMGKVTVGGRKISKNVRYGKNTQTQLYIKGETLNSGRESKRDLASFEWGLTQVPIKYDVDDEIQNNGATQIVDTIADEVAAAQEDMMDKLSEVFYGDYDGDGSVDDTSSTDTKGVLSINAALLYTTSKGGVATYGGIKRTALSDWWVGNIDDGSTVGAATTVSFNQWDYMVDKCLQYRGDRRNLMAITGSALYRKWKSLVRSKEGDLKMDGMMAKAGFAAFSIDGIELVLDDNVPSGYFYMLDLSKWEWRINSKRNFKITAFKWQGENNNGVDEYLARVLLAHNLVCWKPRVNYIATNMS